MIKRVFLKSISSKKIIKYKIEINFQIRKQMRIWIYYIVLNQHLLPEGKGC